MVGHWVFFGGNCCLVAGRGGVMGHLVTPLSSTWRRRWMQPCLVCTTMRVEPLCPSTFAKICAFKSSNLSTRGKREPVGALRLLVDFSPSVSCCGQCPAAGGDNELKVPASQWDNVRASSRRLDAGRTPSSHGDASSPSCLVFSWDHWSVPRPPHHSPKEATRSPLRPRDRMQRLPHLGAGHTHNIIIVNPNGLAQLPGCQVNQASGRTGAHQHHPAPVGASSSHQHPDPGIRTTLLHQEQSQQARRSLPIRQSNRPMVTSVLHHHPLPSTAQGYPFTFSLPPISHSSPRSLGASGDLNKGWESFEEANSLLSNCSLKAAKGEKETMEEFRHANGKQT